ncbi:ELG1 Telomere length regulation protein ELG1 [Candida maltosa Xu316]
MLKINPQKLAEIKQYDNPLLTKGTQTAGKSSKSFFASMMQASRSASKLDKINQDKQVRLPDDLTRDQFHVYEREIVVPRRITLEKRLVYAMKHCTDPYIRTPDLLSAPNANNYTYLHESRDDLRQYALEKLPALLSSSVLEFAFNKIGHASNDPWTDTFKPEKMNDILMRKQNRADIYNWISNSFLKLKSQAPIKDMKRKLKQRKQDAFLVYDDDVTDEEIFSPFLIIQGSCGSGKSAAVYTAMNELDGYVHEINAGQNRGRRDILANLKELCTTQSVKDTQEFHKGLVLLEDVNILFEQDKTFWQAIQEIINVSKRPIVMTCEELWNIPKSLVEFAQHDNSIVFIDDATVSKDLIIDYLWLCCLVYRCDVDRKILDEVVEDNWNGYNYDIRGSLLTCQVICQPKNDGLVHISKKTNPGKTHESLLEASKYLELNSASDLIQSRSISQIGQQLQPNEFEDIYWIDDSTNATLPFELNIGHILQSNLEFLDSSIPSPKYFINDLRYETNKFIGSRSINCTRRTTRNFALDTVGVPDTSILNYINNESLVLDVMPIARSWSRFQKSIDQIESEQLTQGKPSVKSYLKYRDFLYQSTLESTI